MNLRPYQNDCIAATLKGFKDFWRQLIVLPTGGGKTIVFAWLAKKIFPRRTLVLAHREELVNQAAEKIFAVTGIPAEIEKADQSASLDAVIVVASIQTITRRLEKWPADHFTLIVCDEAHHALADQWQAGLNHFTAARVLGVTATPGRGDKKNLGKYFENIAYEIPLFELIHQGFLSKIMVQSLPLQINLKQVKTNQGDYDATQLGDALEPYLAQIAGAIGTHARNRKTLIFLPLVDTSKKMVQVLRSAGIPAEHIDGNSPDRKEILERYHNNEFRVLCNAVLLTEGYDEPSIDCVVNLRPTRSHALYSQIVGRGTRPHPGKENLLLLDFLWQHEKHDLIRPAHLIASNDDIAQAITRKSQEQQDVLDLEDLNASAAADRESALRELLKKQAKRKARAVDAIEFSLSINSLDLAEYEPEMFWESLEPTGAQLRMIGDRGLDVETVKNRGHASKIIETLNKRTALKLATPKQIKHLIAFGHPCPHTTTMAAASAYLESRFQSKKKQPPKRNPFDAVRTAIT